MSDYPPIPGYELLKRLARNGHPAYLGRQLSSGRLVRLNVVHRSGDSGRMVADRLRHQARVLAALDHPNIVRLIEVGDAPGHVFFSALEQIEADSLAEIVRHGEAPDEAEIIHIARAVAGALDHAHGRRVVHGNLHPKHILVDRTGYVFLIGFGEVDARRPEEMVFGNPHFLAPEQFAGFDRAVPQTDVYELAEVVFFLLLGGWYPYQDAGGIGQLVDRKRSGPVPSVRDRRPELPRRVDLTLQRAMALRPEDRFRSVAEFVEELDAAWE